MPDHFDQPARAIRAELLQAAVQAVDVGITIADRKTPDAGLIFVNDTFCRITGYRRDQLLGRNCRLLQGRDTDGATTARIRAALDAAETLTVEILNYRCDGTPFWNELTLAPVPGKGARPRYFVGIQRDVSAARRTRAALEDSESRLRQLTAGIPGTVYQIRRGPAGDLEFPFLSAGLIELFGVEPEAAMADARLMFEPVEPADLPELIRSTERSEADLSPWSCSFRIRVDGRVKWIHGSSVPVRAPDGSTIWNGVLIDVTAQREAEHELRLIRTAVDAATDAIGIADAKRRAVYMNPAMCKMVGRSIDEINANGGPLSLIEQRAQRSTMLGAAGRGEAWSGELGIRRRDGHVVPTLARINAVRGPDGGPVGSVGVFHDLTDRLRREAALRERQQRLDQAQLIARMGDWRWLVGGQDVAWSPALYEIFGVDPATFTPTLDGVLALIAPEDRAGVRASLEHAVTDAASHRMEFRVRRPDGQIRHLWAEGHCECDDAGKVVAQFGICQDITERRRSEERIAYLAYHDALTGLPNRALFLDRLDQALARARRSNLAAAVLILDLDRFKDVNDSLGHPGGDRLLQEVGRRLQGCLREMDTVARFGGDEFAVILCDLADAAQAGDVARRMLDSVSRPIAFRNSEIHTATSVGITVFPGDGSGPDQLLSNADIALFQAKKQGRNRLCFFAGEMKARIEHRQHIERELRHALAHDHLELHYQPIVRLADRAVTGFEALLRWPHAERGLLTPQAFLHAAEDSDLLVPLGDHVLRTAGRQLGEWRRCGLRPGYVAVNLAGGQFQRDDLVAKIEAMMGEAGITSEDLALEITEGVLLDDASNKVAETLHRLHALGVGLALDDFGTGHAALLHLKQYPVSRLKIDRTFVHDIGVDPEGAAIARAIISLGRSLGIEVVAEGVETEAQLAFLSEHGCDFVQGFLFARPMPGSSVPAFLSTTNVIETAGGLAELEERLERDPGAWANTAARSL